MVQPESKTKIRLIRDAIVPRKQSDGSLIFDGPVQKAETIVEVEPEVAKELCDVGFQSPPQYRGERGTHEKGATFDTIYRAVRL